MKTPSLVFCLVLGLGIAPVPGLFVPGLPLATAQAASLSGNFLAQTVRSSKPHREALERLIRGAQGIPPWVLNMVQADTYVGLASIEVPVEGRPMQLFFACAPKRCQQSAIKVLFSADGKHAVMRVDDQGAPPVFLGSPDAAEKAALERKP
ncbi:inhibitor of vertebrate lysozyme family protein [Allorhizobium sp. BGMRC 0089]|uniref:Ivy family c-type lysozyme inhibitor n=1 Tax=Allorhizobium sonneratiae TaxID=2934936 RepID=UPI002033D692|nr:Ivy family c-type lysozyme inhibitor [Allorhizobium sonneratiae]MCM2294459.1 inhibitor of vertebrate lysozyme family protein [Allorhizobium sonneratiae]